MSIAFEPGRGGPNSTAIETYPRLDSWMLDLHDFHYITSDCEACHMTSHPGTWTMERYQSMTDEPRSFWEMTVTMITTTRTPSMVMTMSISEGEEQEKSSKRRISRVCVGKILFLMSQHVPSTVSLQVRIHGADTKEDEESGQEGLSRLDREDVVQQLTDEGFVNEVRAFPESEKGLRS
ncbi:hypothetical protein BJ742DRAFT_247831 [Cladochytrium replicatum]|nr:hypothetical protein BJ742DRAFT_247831 [Cladochytrium replicatum]